MGVATTHDGFDGLMKLPVWSEIDIMFDATSAGARQRHSQRAAVAGKVMVDLKPAAIGPYVIPVVIGDEYLDANPALIAKVLAVIPMGRAASEEEVASMVAYLATDEAAFVTGQVISVNGGTIML